MKKIIIESIKDSLTAVEQLLCEDALHFIEQAGNLIVHTFRKGGKVLLAGNGGSLADAMHFAEELSGQFRKKRTALPALALSDPAYLTCVGNDMGFQEVFARGIEALGKEGDLFIGLTTSGNSPNIVRAVERAKENGLSTILFLGKGGGLLKGAADLELIINGFAFSDRIQEAHMTAIHIIIEIVEQLLFSEVYSSSY